MSSSHDTSYAIYQWIIIILADVRSPLFFFFCHENEATKILCAYNVLFLMMPCRFVAHFTNM